MDKQQLRNILQQPYKFDNWKQVVDFVFPNVSYFRDPQPIPHESDKIQSFRQLGTVRLNDGKNLAVFEVKVAENINIPRNRVALRSLVTPLIDQERNHRVLVIYEQGKEDYRFTFTARETGFDEETADFVQRETDRKRFTYVLGGNESCRTASDRFWELSHKKNQATIKDVESAFSVERLSKEFFTKYKAHYTAFADYLAASTYKVTTFSADDKRIRDFVKVLLGRIVFLHFVQRKGWLGASDIEFTDGDKNFMLNYWKQSGKDESFYTAYLSSLFFGGLNKEGRPGQAFTMPDGKKVCVPFLGGGLFEKDRNEPELITFPPQLFDDLFNFFGEYNFTIDENDPFENEVGIDPEMLGHIFENLLEDNKDKGAFYTPKPIVKYMCQESLIQYLLTQLEQNGVAEHGSEAQKDLEEKLGNFVKKYEANALIDYDNLLANALHTIKVCDPAIGSGAFPMGILNEMVMLINVLHQASPDVVEQTWQMDNWQPSTVKKHIIQNSIYGVDIEKGAVDIARLRFWLSLVLDEEKPSALPSLDYKIVVGNSLVSKLGDDIIDIDWTLNQKSHELFGEELATQKKELLKKLIGHQRKFYTALGDKKELASKIRNLKIDLLINQLDLMIDKQNIAVEPKPEDYRNKSKAKFTEAYNRYLQCMGWQQQIVKLKSLKAKPDIPLEFFDWKLDFPEVMNEQVVVMVGFDVVIGNPPYVNFRDIKNSLDKSYYIRKFATAEYQSDLYILFIEKGYNILKRSGGQFAFIVPNSITNNLNNSKIRKYILDNSAISSIVNTPIGVFEAATVDTVIICSSLSKASTEIRIFQMEKSFFKLLGVKTPIDFKDNQNYDFDFLTSEQSRLILKKIEANAIILDELCLSTSGIKEYEVGKGKPPQTKLDCKNKIFNSDKKIDNSYREHVTGSEINNYVVEYSGQYIKYGECLAAPREPFFFESIEKIIIREIPAKGKLKVAFTDKNYTVKNTAHIFVPKNSFSAKYLCGILNSSLIGYYFI